MLLMMCAEDVVPVRCLLWLSSCRLCVLGWVRMLVSGRFNTLESECEMFLTRLKLCCVQVVGAVGMKYMVLSLDVLK